MLLLILFPFMSAPRFVRLVQSESKFYTTPNMKRKTMRSGSARLSMVAVLLRRSTQPRVPRSYSTHIYLLIIPPLSPSIGIKKLETG